MSQTKYYVGIDFGHGETSVSRVPGTNGQKVSRIPLRVSGDFSYQKVFSAICRGENGEWQFVTSKDDLVKPSVIEGFKGQIATRTPQQLEAIREFAKLVFKSILANDPDLEYDPQTGEANFVICIACPTDWGRQNDDRDHRKEYLEFFQREAGIKPAIMCLNESDAAFYTKFETYSPSDTVFVIDLGSSTLDFTTYHNSICNRDLCWGPALGAHKVEDKIVNYGYTEAEDKDENMENMLLVTTERERLHIGPAESALSLAARFAKEEYFTKLNYGPTTYSLDLKVQHLVPKWAKKKQPAFSVEIDSTEVDRVINDYISALDIAFDEAVGKLQSHGISPNKVLLSGGASRMPFVKKLAEKAFPKADIIRDNFPEWVVSDGAARYAEVHSQALAKADALKTTFTNWANSNLVDVIQSAGLSAFKDALREIMKEDLNSKYLSNESENNLNHFENIIRGILNTVTSSYRFKNRADQRFKDIVNAQIESQLKAIIKKQYGKDVTISQSFADPTKMFINVPVDTSYLHSNVETIGEHLFCGGFFDTDVNWEKPRLRSEREQLIEAAIQYIPDDYEYNYNGDTYEMIDHAVSKIDEVLRANGLFSVSM